MHVPTWLPQLEDLLDRALPFVDLWMSPINPMAVDPDTKYALEKMREILLEFAGLFQSPADSPWTHTLLCALLIFRLEQTHGQPHPESPSETRILIDDLRSQVDRLEGKYLAQREYAESLSEDIGAHSDSQSAINKAVEQILTRHRTALDKLVPRSQPSFGDLENLPAPTKLPKNIRKTKGRPIDN